MGETTVHIFDDPKKSQTLALVLGALGAPLIAIGIAIESTLILIVGILVLGASGAAWAIRGVKEDQVAD